MCKRIVLALICTVCFFALFGCNQKFVPKLSPSPFPQDISNVGYAVMDISENIYYKTSSEISISYSIRNTSTSLETICGVSHIEYYKDGVWYPIRIQSSEKDMGLKIPPFRYLIGSISIQNQDYKEFSVGHYRIVRVVENDGTQFPISADFYVKLKDNGSAVVEPSPPVEKYFLEEHSRWM